MCLRHAIFLITLATVPLHAQVNKEIHFVSNPAGARVTNISGKTDFLGNTPFSHEFGFHSEKSVIRTRISACGYYDTIIKISPAIETVNILMDKKKFVILPETENDLFTENEHKVLAGLLKSYLDNFSAKNTREPVNFMDFAIVGRKDQKLTVTLIFETLPEFLPASNIMYSDSLLVFRWNEWFAGSVSSLRRKELSILRDPEFIFSVISGKENLSIRHLPGVDVQDELKTKTFVSQGERSTVTTTTWYFETVTSPTFNTALEQNLKYNEFLYRLSPAPENASYDLNGTAVLNFSRGKLNTLFESDPGLNGRSMLTRFLGMKK